jgi:hypothetical protein
LPPAAAICLPMLSLRAVFAPGRPTTSTALSVSVPLTICGPYVVANCVPSSTWPCRVLTWLDNDVRSLRKVSTSPRRLLVIGPLRAVVPTTIPRASAKNTATMETR